MSIAKSISLFRGILGNSIGYTSMNSLIILTKSKRGSESTLDDHKENI